MRAFAQSNKVFENDDVDKVFNDEEVGDDGVDDIAPTADIVRAFAHSNKFFVDDFDDDENDDAEVAHVDNASTVDLLGAFAQSNKVFGDDAVDDNDKVDNDKEVGDDELFWWSLVEADSNKDAQWNGYAPICCIELHWVMWYYSCNSEGLSEKIKNWLQSSCGK